MRRETLKRQYESSVLTAALVSSIAGAALGYVLLAGYATQSIETPLQRVIIAIFPHAISVLLIFLLIKRGITRLSAKLESAQTQLLASTHTQNLLHLLPAELNPLSIAYSDLRERVSLEILEQQRQMDNMSNQLRGPLTAIKAYATHALQSQDSDTVKKAICQLDGCVDKVLRTFDQITALNRASRVYESSPVDLNFVISDAIAEFVEIAVKNDIELVHELSPEPAIVYGDWRSLHALVSNLIENSLNATTVGGLITIRVRMDDSIILSVTDTGSGIPERERESVFQTFHRIDGSNSQGSGLGMAIVKKVAASHGVALSIKDGLNSRGTAVLAKFPKNVGLPGTN
ncbi:MAG: HAMP domain-containing histidine kinase [Candidatus Obscuribacterales bacterium]|nr:HAMP domain-containing histidine kinase [Candidatus Obscuribacterales bacterium]